MKIEIELEELDALRSETSRCRQALEASQKELLELKEKTNPKALKNHAIIYAHFLAQKYIETILTGIGFNDTAYNALGNYDNPIIFDHAFDAQHFGELWYRAKDKLNITVGAQITNDVRRAFITIGVKPEPPKNEEEIAQDMLIFKE